MMTFVLQDGWSPLHVASFNGHLDIVRALIEAGASISQANKVGTVLVNQPGNERACYKSSAIFGISAIFKSLAPIIIIL